MQVSAPEGLEHLPQIPTPQLVMYSIDRENAVLRRQFALQLEAAADHRLRAAVYEYQPFRFRGRYRCESFA